MSKRYVPRSKRKSSGLGVAIALVLWSLCFLAFPRFMGMTDAWLWALSTTGFILLLIGILGICSELFYGN